MLKSSFHAAHFGYRSTISFLAAHRTYTAFSFVALSTMLAYVLFSYPHDQSESYIVARGDIRQYVKVTGQVEASKDADLSFESSGQVTFIGVKPGDKVSQGKLLATISAGDAQSNLLAAQANLAKEEATLAQLTQGARKEELALKEQAVRNAESSLDQVYSDLPSAIHNVDAVTADIIKNKFAPLFTFDNSRYLLSFTSCDQRLQSETEIKRTLLEDSLADFQKKSSPISVISSKGSVDSVFSDAYTNVALTGELVTNISNLLLLPCSSSNPTLDTYRTVLSGVKTTLSTLSADIGSKRTALVTAKNVLNQATKELELAKAGTDPYKLQAENALIAQARAQVESAQNMLKKTLVYAPFGGTISDVGMNIGETVSAGKTVISMLATNSYEIKAKIPEMDIIKIAPNQDVEVTLDAYGDDLVFPASVIRVNPKSANEGGVPVYTAIIAFKGADERIKEGMTSNVRIITKNKTNTLLIPARFVVLHNKSDGEVFIKKNGTVAARPITVGVRGDDGTLEVQSGLLDGDEIVPPPVKSPSTK